MAAKPERSRSGGIFIALGAIVGVLGGRFWGEPTIGLLAGLAIGTALALALWLRDRRG